jgi:hypothetical protein
LPLSAGDVPRAPAQDGAVVARPPLAEAGALLERNRARLRTGPDLLGRPWTDLRRLAREEAARAAADYLARRGEPVPAAGAASLVLAGHQPELFHPGAWVKNFALQGLARRHGVTPLNLVVDNDTVKATALRVPGRAGVEAPRPHAGTVPFDRWGGEAPYEERAVADPGLFASFADRAMGLLAGWGYEPLLPAFWAEVLRQQEKGPLLGECFAAARRELERSWGCHNLEVPLSAVCRTEAFAWFGCHLLAELPRFHALHNERVRAYRAAHGLRSRNHPVPDLAADGDWLEAPLWGWRAGATRRGRVFARLRPDRVELRVANEAWPALPRDGQAAVAAWRGLEGQGLKVRSRALTTTLFARLLLGDLFIHGIGGGKYDELTDELIRGFYGVEAPAFVVLSATRLLPLPAPRASPEECRRLAHELRDVHYNPQRHLGIEADDRLRDLASEKEALVRRRPADVRERREWFAALRALTARLREPLLGRAQRLRAQWAECRRRLEAGAVLRRRDYAFPLYPEAALRPFCTQFL